MDGQLSFFGNGASSSPKARERPSEAGEQDTVKPVFTEGDRIRSIKDPAKEGTVIMVSLVTCLLRVLWDGDPEPDFIERDKAEHISPDDQARAGKGRKWT
jgi:hypothetical protein